MSSSHFNFYSLLPLFLFFISITNGDLVHNFYSNSCPSAEKLITGVVSKNLAANPGLGAGLIRLHFHDCFVRGCDASVLLDSIDGKPAEKDNFVNKGLRGYEIIDEAKALLEDLCPVTVSCADLLAYAARDAAAVLGGINYNLPGGRRDGVVSIKDEVLGSLPAPNFNLSMLENFFAAKGLTKDDLVILTGAHSIGQTHCGFIKDRIRNFNNTSMPDPSMDSNFADTLKTICPVVNSSSSNQVPLDFESPNRLEAGYYKSILNHKVMFTSDQTLLDDMETQDR